MAWAVSPGIGTTIKYNAVKIDGVLSIDGPTLTYGEKEKSNLDSKRKQYRPTLPDSGTITCEVQYHPNTHATLQAMMILDASTAVSHAILITYPSGATYATNGFLTECKLGGMGVEDDMSMSLTFRDDGSAAPVFTPGT